MDIYPLNDVMVIWIKDSKLCRLERKWDGQFFVSGSTNNLAKLMSHHKILPFVKKFEWVKMFEKPEDIHKSTTLKIILKKYSDISYLSKTIERLNKFGVYRLYNIDIPFEQSYLYENDLFPLGKYNVDANWTAMSEMMDTDYELPHFTKTYIEVIAKKTASSQKFSDPIHSVLINGDVISGNSEEKIISDFIQQINLSDPDFIITKNGDAWDLPYLAHRAKLSGIDISLSRERNCHISSKIGGNSYFSYGQVHFKPLPVKLYGRIHIDQSNCFLCDNEPSFEGLYEVARTCRLPIQTASRASIGKCMSSIQYYNATKRNLLIPWKPTTSEIFKTRLELFVGDRGGIILEPSLGVFENVAELDFVSLFGNIMLKKNISSETINCKCCSDSNLIVPDIRYHVCKKQGIIPQSIRVLLNKRRQYSELIEKTIDTDKKSHYVKRKAALKWILVTSFGYLGFNNAKFGRIDAHMAVCAFARYLLLKAISIAEKNDFTILHGIVDSLWVHKNNARINDYKILCNKISQETNFELSLDVYDWISFLTSRGNRSIPVPNKYFGRKKDGSLKIRGIDERRHDTPKLFVDCQNEILTLLGSCQSIKEIKQILPKAKKIQKKYRDILVDHAVSIDSLVFTNRISHGQNGYKTNTIQSDAIKQLKMSGKELCPGQKISYVIHDYKRKSNRVTPIPLVSSNNYDVDRYVELLDRCCKEILLPFEG